MCQVRQGHSEATGSVEFEGMSNSFRPQVEEKLLRITGAKRHQEMN